MLASFRHCSVVRGLQRDDLRGSFGPPDTLHGTPEKEEDGESIITPMEKDAHLEGERRKLLAIVVARSSWWEVKLNNGGGPLREVKGERRGKRTSTTRTFTRHTENKR